VPSWLKPGSVTEALALVGALGYGATYAACALFYGLLGGVEPADVGLGYAEILAQTAVFLVLAMATGVLLVALLRVRREPLRTVVLGVLLVATALVAWAFIEKAAVVLVIAAAAGIFLVAFSNLEPEPWKALVGGTLVVFIGLFGWMALDVRRIRAGKAAAGVLFMLPWSDSTVADVRWTDTGVHPAILPHCVIRLGESAGTEVLYDPSTSTTLRVPQSSVAVVLRPRSATCKGGGPQALIRPG
jgi:hypothetical protein